MQPDPTELLITILGQTFPYDTPSDGIAVSPDGQVKKETLCDCTCLKTKAPQHFHYSNL